VVPKTGVILTKDNLAGGIRMEVRFLRKKEWKYILLLLWQTGNNQTYLFLLLC